MVKSTLSPAKGQEKLAKEMDKENNVPKSNNPFFERHCLNYECLDRLVCHEGRCYPCCIQISEGISCSSVFGGGDCQDVLEMVPVRFRRRVSEEHI